MGIMKNFKADENNVRVLGRSIYRNEIRYLSYSCSAVEFVFTGKKVTAEIWTDWELKEEWQHIFQGYAAVMVNDSGNSIKRFPLMPGVNTYTIYESDNAAPVKIRIMKFSEASFGKMGIVSISADGEIKPAPKPNGLIEFIGDSITCGYGIEGVWNTDNFKTAQENPWDAYAASTARMLGMEFDLIAWSGIGVISCWVDDDSNGPSDVWVMPDLYDYTDRGLENILGIKDDSLKEIWDNSKRSPEICVINLGTNDNSYTRNIPERVKLFGERYKAFLQKIRDKNPEAYIICTLGAMGQDLYPEIEGIVSEMNDPKILSMAFDVQLESDGIGADWHPNAVTHKKMAEKLAAFIKKHCK